VINGVSKQEIAGNRYRSWHNLLLRQYLQEWQSRNNSQLGRRKHNTILCLFFR